MQTVTFAGSQPAPRLEPRPGDSQCTEAVRLTFACRDILDGSRQLRTFAGAIVASLALPGRRSAEAAAFRRTAACRRSVAGSLPREAFTVSNESGRARMMHLLELEFEYLQKANDKFDVSRFTIKNWAVTTTGALLALSVTADSSGLALLGLVTVAVFAYLEVLYIYIQDHVIARCNRVEELLDSTMRTDGPLAMDDYRFGISQGFKGRFEPKGVLLALRGRPHIYILYLVLLAATAIDIVVLKFLT